MKSGSGSIHGDERGPAADRPAAVDTDPSAKCAGSATLLTERFHRALVCAASAHAGQYRKGTAIPYIAHPLAVAALVLEHDGTEDEAIAALLHDTVEDAGGAELLADIRASFGEVVADVVDGCSDAYGDGSTAKPPWKERKVHHLESLERASRSVLLVTAADKLHNVRSVLRDYETEGESLWSRFNGGREGTLWYYGQLKEILNRRFPSSLTSELIRAAEQLESLAWAGSNERAELPE